MGTASLFKTSHCPVNPSNVLKIGLEAVHGKKVRTNLLLVEVALHGISLHLKSGRIPFFSLFLLLFCISMSDTLPFELILRWTLHYGLRDLPHF